MHGCAAEDAGCLHIHGEPRKTVCASAVRNVGSGNMFVLARISTRVTNMRKLLLERSNVAEEDSATCCRGSSCARPLLDHIAHLPIVNC